MNASLHIPEEMRRVYVQRRRGDLVKLTDAVAKRDAEVFKTIGHQLKGNASTYGYLDLEAIGIRLEKVTSFDDPAIANQLVSDFKTWLERNEAAR